MAEPLVIGRYALYDRIAAGGMATVYIGRLVGPVGFARTVAIKRLHPQFASDAEFVAMFLDEARLAARIQHPNVVSTLDVVATMGELFLVMDYVRGEPASALLRQLNARGERLPPRIMAAVVSGALQGLHAAHTATDEAGHPLGIVHRDVSPQNVLVGVDGTPRVLDFGVAKAANRLHTTRGGEIKGKLSYMPPEQLEGASLDCTADVYAMGLLIFELLSGRRMFNAAEDVSSIAKIMRNEIVVPSEMDPALVAWDPIVRKAAAKSPADRYATARAMALEVERVQGIASSVEVADFVERLAGDSIKERTKRIAEIESNSGVGNPAAVQAALTEELARFSQPTLPAVGSVEAARDDSKKDKAPASVVTHAISVANVSVRKPLRRWLPVAVSLAVVLVGLEVSHVMSRDPSSGRSAASAAAAPSPPPPVPLAAEGPTPPPTSSGPPAATAAPVAKDDAPPPPPPRAVPVASPASTSASPRPASTPRPASKAATAPAKPNCERPTTVDGAGHVHFRPECL